MRTLVLRLNPGDDLRASLDSALAASGSEAAFIVSGIGSLNGASIRLAGAPTPARIEGELEILTLAGSLSPDGSHLHISVSDAEGSSRGLTMPVRDSTSHSAKIAITIAKRASLIAIPPAIAIGLRVWSAPV